MKDAKSDRQTGIDEKSDQRNQAGGEENEERAFEVMDKKLVVTGIFFPGQEKGNPDQKEKNGRDETGEDD